MGLCALTSLVVFTAILIPPLGFRFLPYYPPTLEHSIASLYDSSENIFSQSTLPSYNSSNFFIINRGNHFAQYLIPGKAPKNKYFEGWYYKLVTKDQRTSVILIPGVFFDGQSFDDHGFIMVGIVLRDQAGKVTYSQSFRKKFDIRNLSVRNFGDEVNPDRYEFIMRNSDYGKQSEENGTANEENLNVFTDSHIKVNIEDILSGDLTFNNCIHYPGNMLNPNIMGFFGYLDATVGMQCVHKVVNVDGDISGSLKLQHPQQMDVDFTGGKIYVEGDYGNEFPDTYTWMASNHFASNPGSSMLLSVASVPLPNGSFRFLEITGFIGFIYDKRMDKIYRFGTYTGAKATVINTKAKSGPKNEELSKSKIFEGIAKSANKIEIEIEDPQYLYSIVAVATRENAVVLWGPKQTASQKKRSNGVFTMERYVEEMLDAQIQVIVRRRSDKKIVFEGIGLNGGLEIQV